MIITHRYLILQARARQGHNNVYVAEGYNSDDEVYATEKAITANQEPEPAESHQQIGPLAALDHEDIDYEPFAKDFYTPVPKIAKMTAAEVLYFLSIPNFSDSCQMEWHVFQMNSSRYLVWI